MNKTALITGSTSGIGLAIARQLAAQGYNICFNGLEKEGADIARSVAEEFGVEYLFSPANLLNTVELNELAQEALQKFKRVDVLVNNAGIQFVSPVEDFPDEKWEAIIQLNLTAAFKMTKALWKPMKQNNFGRIVNVASAHGLVASEYKSAYVASKHGIIGFTKTIALEGAPFGITANAVCPGYVHTPIVDAQIADQMKAHNLPREEVIENVLLGKQAIKKFIPVETIASAISYFLADEAATITGIALPIEAGWTAQ